MKNPLFTWEPGDQSEERISWMAFTVPGRWRLARPQLYSKYFIKLHLLADGLPAIRQPTPAETDI